ncbi:uncharacterized protein LOC122365643 [Amphibalanus amphitrite]|uniref:uncharacterized protein LOC122365643 n=1 Tax=Amphibalanus amphitrite TaxID=1232801 RepID=UPI001C91E5E0|nr:uncharacterized protein LOC122365643 [Amphibalanus amphitrite]XP_043192984.1 uncharacterized protein LOC122365643 [Amphibalanus amphitrite]XP_043192985.1 uncharacterized protein LOC122365643 [Amphibalanus amphitrite]XP_043192986.1 uncharacterized protein LOC122365643 [Amphibalanus amphitrite]
MDLKEIESFEALVLLSAATDTPEKLKALLQNNRLIRRMGKHCCRSKRMKERVFGLDAVFGKAWGCPKCYKVESFRKASLFDRSHVEPMMILKMAYLYVRQNLNVTDIRSMVSNPPAVATVTDWLQFFRDVMSKNVMEETRGKIGGPGKLVVVDETVLGHRRYHRGQPIARETCWVLGMYEVETKTGILEFIPNRKREEIVPRIVSKVELGSEIHTDERRSYASLTAAGYIHKTVNHSQTFMAPDGTHTNHVLAYFSRVKQLLRRKNVKGVDRISSYLDEFMWRERHKDSLWPDFIAAIQRRYRFH